MKHLNFLSKSGSRSCGHSIVTFASTVGSPSVDRRGIMLRLLSVLVLVLTFGVGNVWGANVTGTFTKITSTDALTTGYYVIVASESASTNDKAVGASVDSNKRITGVAVTITSGTTISNPDAAIVYLVTKTNSNYTFYNVSTSKYLYQASTTSGKGMGFKDASANITCAGYNSNSPIGFKFTLDGASNNYFKWNNANSWFANYANDYSTTMAPVRLFKAYKVTYDGNGKTGGTVPTDATYYSGNGSTSVTTKTNSGNLVKTGYTFAGWNTKADGAGIHYAAGGTFTISANTTLYAEWEEAASCSTPPTVGTDLTSVSATANSITATVPISSIGGCNITENGLVYSTTAATPTVGGAGCTKVTTTACGATAANKTITISELTCGTTYYVRGFATNGANTSYTNVTTQATSACPKYTVTLMDDDSELEQATAGASVNLPARSGCDGYTFAGWTSSWTSAQTTWTTTTPTIINSGAYSPTGNINLYPVYTKSENSTSSIKKTLTFGTSYASNQSSLKNVTIFTGITASATNGTNNNPTYFTTSPGTWRIYNGSELTISSTIGKITKIEFTKSSDFSMLVKSGSSGSLSSTTWTYNDGANSVTFTVGGTTKLSAIAVTYTGTASTTSYISVPNCCDPLGQINGSFFWTTHFCPAWPEKHRSKGY